MNDACVILAAGRGRRMGGRNKALLSLHGQTFLQTIAGACKTASIDEVVVVVAAPHLDETRAAAEHLGLRWICNEKPEDGMASSVAQGFAFALDHFSANHCWLWPVDVPAIGKSLLAQLSAHARESSVVIPTHANRGGHPVLVGRSIFDDVDEVNRDFRMGSLKDTDLLIGRLADIAAGAVLEENSEFLLKKCIDLGRVLESFHRLQISRAPPLTSRDLQ
ncbi:MAG: NTP transferase domain-containing protein [Acidobacteria bacterium]|nr:NTP transferase domain-containing protein [Acidobacteriota bacterium]